MNKAIYLKVIAILAFAFSSGFAFGSEPQQEFLQLSTGKKIEYFVDKPVGKGPFPVLLLIHPHQEWPSKIGAAMFIKSGFMNEWTEKGWKTVAISQPGYGHSDGPSDFCGPSSQQAVAEIIKTIREMDDAKKDSIVVYGGSRGAVLAALAAENDPQLAGVILKAGLYDFTDAYKSYPWYSLIKWTMLWEMGGASDSKLAERSALGRADQIKVPVLMFHGSGDDRAPIAYAKSFADKVKSSGGSVDFIAFDSEHVIAPQKIKEDMSSFLEKVKR